MRMQSFDANWGYWGQDASVMCEGQLEAWTNEVLFALLSQLSQPKLPDR